MAEARVCLGTVLGAHGVRGLVRVKSFTEVPEDIAAYGPLSDEAGQRSFRVAVAGRAKAALLVRIEGIADRDAAQALAGTRLYVARQALPEIAEEDSFYHADLIGLAAEDPAGRPLGRVRALHNFGAGDILELAPAGNGAPLMVPFTRGVVPVVDLDGGRLVVELPQEVEARPDEGVGS